MLFAIFLGCAAGDTTPPVESAPAPAGSAPVIHERWCGMWPGSCGGAAFGLSVIVTDVDRDVDGGRLVMILPSARFDLPIAANRDDAVNLLTTTGAYGVEDVLYLGDCLPGVAEEVPAEIVVVDAAGHASALAEVSCRYSDDTTTG